MPRFFGVVPGALLLLSAAGHCDAAVAPAAENDVRRDAVVAAVERVMPSVVNIGTETIIRVRDPFEDFFREFWNPYHRQMPSESRYSLGSGVIIDEAGYLLTNDHVVRRADKIWVKLSTATNIYEAVVVASDSQSDIALLKLKTKPGEKFTAIKFAPDDDLLLGETVLALGNPFGLGGSVSRGILSSKSRLAPIENHPLDVPNWLQTDAPINPGNSGGPLVDLRGELIGLNAAILREAQGIGFAVPVKRINDALSEMLTPESSESHLWFGARVKGGAGPLVIASVQPESPAGRAGLKAGDTILLVNGKTPRGLIELRDLLVATPEPTLTIQRESVGPRNVPVRLVAEKTFFNANLIQKKLGVSLQELTPKLADALGLNSTEGFVVSGVERGTPAAENLQPGYLVISIDGHRPADLIEAAKILHRKKAGETAQLGVVIHQRSGNMVSYRQGVVELPVR